MTERSSAGAAAESTWKAFYRIAGAGALIAVAFAVIQVLIEIIGVGVMRIAVPTTVVGWFSILQSDQLLGLAELTLFQLPAFALLIPMFLALHAAFGAYRRPYVTLATVLALVGIAVYLPSNPALAMLSLSHQWAGATTDAQRGVFEAAGEAIMAISAGTGLVVGTALVMVSVVIDSAAMRGVPIFGRASPVAGFLAGVFALASFLMGPSIGIFGLEAAAAIFLLWTVLVARTLLALARH